ncbi:hypothetical protein HPB47_011794 [Ixodes persulcatus]|uniref:Uncharacterized protein n=1 Tax=Ixodes persulcatus TaxID=34615 RepID=A0AC60NVA6_IXOPE|nr:hypothetical protein HPB47_011794 [Ixodes persulcatus]
MDDLACPRCRTTKYRNPSLKLMVNVCGHALCENCVELLFVKGSGSCPQCNVPLRRGNFRVQIFEDAGVEKEVDIRRKILKDYNKREEDFETLRAYNDYLEEVETIIFNLANEVDVEATRRKVEQYKRDNKAQIQKGKLKPSREEEFLEEVLELEQQEAELRREQLAELEREARREKIKQKESLIDDLMFSDLPANRTPAGRGLGTWNAFQTGAFSILFRPRIESGLEVATNGVAETRAPAPARIRCLSRALAVSEGPLYAYVALEQDLCGPPVPALDALTPSGYTAHVRAATEPELAGGFQAGLACHRALQDAFSGLFFKASEEVS